jgi:hypothetical protein
MKGVKGMNLLTAIMSFVLIMGFAPMAYATVPMTVSYQCALATTDDVTRVNMTFYLYSGTEPNLVTQWTETINDIPIINGVVSTVLGKSTVITQSILATATYLGVKVGNGPVMEPKTQLNSAVFAMRAAVADALAGEALVFTSSHLAPGIIASVALADSAVTTAKIQDGAVVSNKIGDGQVSSVKTAVSVKVYTGVGSTPATYNVTSADQGLILASGNVTINLPEPGISNGQKFTIKKIDDGLQRSCGASGDIESKMVIVQCGTTPTDWFKGIKKIENRTHKITLRYKNAHVSLVSNGEFWYVTDSNPPTDIFNPIPGSNGAIADVNLVNPVTLTFAAATDCDYRSCDTYAASKLYYMPVFSKSASDKLRTLEDVITTGYPCQQNWSENVTTLTCNTSTVTPSYTGTFRVNVVVRDEAGNMSVYCPPGDNEAPVVLSQFITYTAFKDATYGQIIGLEWDVATSDNKDQVANLKYSVYYTTFSDTCLQSLDRDEPPIPDEDCHNVIAISKQKPDGIWNPATRSATLKYKDSNSTSIKVDLRGLIANTQYFFTVVVEDTAENKKQYAIHDTTTKVD